MARPKKNAVDYFSHDCVPNRVLEIITKLYGNDGYAFYYRLRELLGRENQHTYNCTLYGNWEYLSVSTGVSEDKIEKIIKTLIKLKEIDKKLYEEDKIIWWQSFVDRLEDVYSRRKNNIPDKFSIFVEDDYKEPGDDDIIMQLQMDADESFRNK